MAKTIFLDGFWKGEAVNDPILVEWAKREYGYKAVTRANGDIIMAENPDNFELLFSSFEISMEEVMRMGHEAFGAVMAEREEHVKDELLSQGAIIGTIHTTSEAATGVSAGFKFTTVGYRERV